jgi:hypothetical protein
VAVAHPDCYKIWREESALLKHRQLSNVKPPDSLTSRLTCCSVRVLRSLRNETDAGSIRNLPLAQGGNRFSILHARCSVGELRSPTQC